MSRLDPTLLLCLAVNAVLKNRLGLDHAHAVWEEWQGPLPLFTATEPTEEAAAFPFDTASATDTEITRAVADASPALPGLVGILRRTGVDRARLAPATPLGPFELPRVERSARRRVGRGSALVLQSGDVARAVLSSADGDVFEAVGTAPVPHSPMVAATVTEAGRALRESVLEALAGIAESEGTFEAELRDWQATAASPERPRLDLPPELLASEDHFRLLELALLMQAALLPLTPQLIQAGTPLNRLSRATSAALVAATG